MKVNSIEVLKATDRELSKLSKKNVLSLSLSEMKTIQEYYRRIRRNPTDIELETIAQTWSEHCKHKTLTGIIEYTEITGGKRQKKRYDNLLKETIFVITQELNRPWCVSVFKDNAGVIKFDENYGIAFKVETHNHPSAIEPYGGAATGIGGVIRDIMGVGLGAKPLANTDIFCFGPPDLPWPKLPKGILHPKRIAKGVVSGVRDYGNRMGIPTVNGAVCFDEGYIGNPLVYCGTAGIIPLDKCFKKVLPGDLVLVVGGRTGRDGIHGATFSSVELDKESDATAVQIGNPIVEKKVLDTMLVARDKNLYRAVTDCGAGGFSSAVGELGEDCGVKVNLEKVPLKYAGLKPWEIWLSEAQERMVLAVPLESKEEILQLFASENVEATFIGEFTDDNELTIYYGDDLVAKLDMRFLHKGVPRPIRKALWNDGEVPSVQQKIKSRNIGKDLKELLASLNICSREWIIRQYDHEVQGQTVVKPLQGPHVAVQGPGDAAVIWPYTITDGTKGIVLSCGINPEFGKIDPYWMAASAIDEALRNAVCVGADIEKIALLDNFCWGNTDRPEQLGSLVRAAEACRDMSKAFKVPFISGKDSLHNEYSIKGKSYSIPASLLISAMGVIDDVHATVTMDLKEEGNRIYVLGVTKNELGGSQFMRLLKKAGGFVPKVDAKMSFGIMKFLDKAIEKGLVRSCHDASEGGLLVALAEMCIASGKGMEFDLSKVPTETKMNETEIAFSESNSRFVVEVMPENAKDFETALSGYPMAMCGIVVNAPAFAVKGKEGTIIAKEKVSVLQDCWRKTLDW